VRIHKGSAGFNTALAVLLFLAACAWLGAAFYRQLEPESRTVSAEPAQVRESVFLSGMAVRTEALLCPAGEADGLPRDGSRLAAGETLACLADGSCLTAPQSLLYFADWDGLEYLSPAALFPFEPDAAAALLSAEPQPAGDCSGRLVLDPVWYFAARISQGQLPDTGSRCRLLLQDRALETEALVAAVCQSGEAGFVLLRLSGSSPDFYRLRREEAELVLAEHRGLSLPREAVRQAEDGKHFLLLLRDGLVEEETVDILYKGDDFYLVEGAGLSAGCAVIVSEEGLLG